jgi:hypothetical protein
MRKRITRRGVSLLFCLTVVGLQNVQAADTDWGQLVFQSVNNLVDADGGLFVHYGIALVAAAGFCKLMYGLIRSGIQRLESVGSFQIQLDLWDVLRTLFQVWVLTQLLQYWVVAPWGMTHSLHQIPMYLSDGLVSALAHSKADQVMGYVKTASAQLEKPNPMALLDVAVYLWILIQMGVLSLVMFIITSFAYVGEAVFVVITPLFAWCTFFGTVFSWFWNCVQNMFSFAFYKVLGGVIVYVLSDVMVNFFVTGVSADYSISHWIVLLPVVLMLTGLFVFSLLLIPVLCSSIFNGAGLIGQAAVAAIGKLAQGS